MRKTVSCIIRTYNEAEYIGKLVETLHAQEVVCEQLEIIVIDSQSTDATAEIARCCGASVIEIPKTEFNYSKSLNLGIENSKGELIVILSAHSIPCENDWLRKMTFHFEDNRVAGVYCKQIPWSDAAWHEVLRIRDTFINVSQVYLKEDLPKQIVFSNAASCIRRIVWNEHPFVIMPASEDREWASWAVAQGYKIVYDSQSAVYHSHRDSHRKEAQRMIEAEKTADMKKKRKRNIFLTVKQALGWTCKDIRNIIALENCQWNKTRMIADCIVRNFWYMWDFSLESG